MKVFSRPPAWPGFNNYNLTLLADYLYRESLDGEFSMWCDFALTTNQPPLHVSWSQHPIGYSARIGESDAYPTLRSAPDEPCNAYYSRTLIRPQSFKARWHWCFSPLWEHVDNSPTGCALRIFSLCHTGLPSNWAEQVLGHEPLSYTELGNLGIINEAQYDNGQFEFSRPTLDSRKKSSADPLSFGER